MDLPASAQRFAGEPFHRFGIDEAIFSWNERAPALNVRLAHFQIPGTIDIAFSGVVHHSVMSESYGYAHDEDQWIQDAFIAEARASQLQAFLERYTLLASMREVLVAPAILRHFRVLASNFFVDVLTSNYPIVTVSDDA